MEKPKEYKYVLSVALVLLVSGFYWFELRPSHIKKQCSMVTEVVPADPGVTKEEAEINKILYDKEGCGGSVAGRVQKRFDCFIKQRDLAERPPQPERTETYEASDEEYNTCIRNRGLK